MFNNSTHSKQINFEILQKFIYLFLTDPLITNEDVGSIVHQIYDGKKKVFASKTNNEYSSYVDREKDYGSGMLNAYLYAFNTEANQLSHQLIKNINKYAMHHLGEKLAEKGFSYGEYKKQSNHYSVIPAHQLNDRGTPVLNTFSYTISIEGLKELLTNWLQDMDEGVHAIEINNNDRHGILIRKMDELIIKQECTNLERSKVCIIDGNDLSNVANDLFNTIMTPGYLTSIHSMLAVSHEIIQKTTEKLMQRIFDSFHTTIKTATNELQKIEIITKHVQHIAQLHPFDDGNIRTCYILLNKLLKDNHLPLTILINPNRLDCCSNKEIVNMVQDGQNFYNYILYNKEERFSFIFMNEFLDNTKMLKFKAMDLFDVEPDLIAKFMALINIKTKENKLSEAITTRILLFNSERNQLHDKLFSDLKQVIQLEKEQALQEVFSAIKNQDFSRALRVSSYHQSLPGVQIILNYLDVLPININGQSSNGNTALDWAQKKAGKDKEQIIVLLKSKGAKTASELVQSTAAKLSMV